MINASHSFYDVMLDITYNLSTMQWFAVEVAFKQMPGALPYIHTYGNTSVVIKVLLILFGSFLCVIVEYINHNNPSVQAWILILSYRTLHLLNMSLWNWNQHNSYNRAHAFLIY